MSLLNCPECLQQVSSEAVACPNCGRPIAPPVPIVTPPRVVVTEPDPGEFPKWIIVPIVVVGAILVFAAFALMRNNEDENAGNVNVRVTTPARSTNSRDDVRTETERNQINVPSSSTTVSVPSSPSTATESTTIPQTVAPSSQPNTITAPATRGTVMIDAKVTNQTGTIQTVKNEKFYLLDEDLETILSDADLEPIEGQTLSNSFGLAVLYPSRYADFQRNALNAIKKHIKYTTTTDSTGKASLKDVEPDSYYLFGITKSRNGFAVWSSPVSIINGENKLNLSPARLTEISE